ncbi:MurR/RpiR family transcriptional regulator [Acuticoccus mangrovi]|uniref:MurR/RpiR family transcriptional regulator n=1 Tax=Acuticoccus mangrovi TaxID=2796142 RepID=A0A934IFR8_9HYPH|nr:MurR/RpiR family transcriptional regulator [Acuticoccus mangrovi]
MADTLIIRDRIGALADSLTQAERKLAAALLRDYPYAGLETIQRLGERTGVSPASISRFVHKLDCAGYADFQRHLIQELRDGRLSPADLRGDVGLRRNGFLGAYLTRVAHGVAAAAEAVPEAAFERVADLLADRRRTVHLIGGRVTDTVAGLFARHLARIRPGVVHMASDPETWPQHLLDARPRDVFVILDVRRYQPRFVALAAKAREEGATVVVVTDRWLSPAARHANEVIAIGTESGTAWDTYAPVVALFEALIAWIGEDDWTITDTRIREWDALRIEEDAECASR